MKWKICKLYDKGIENKKAKLVDVECFSLDIDRGVRGMDVDILGTGEREAMALNMIDKTVTHVFPRLKNACVAGCYAEGFRVTGYSEELVGKKMQKVYCEWWVLWPERDAE